MESIVIYLLIYCAVRELFYMRAVNRLTDKIMARNYYDMKISDAQAVAIAHPEPKAPQLVEEEDFSSLQGVGSGF